MFYRTERKRFHQIIVAFLSQTFIIKEFDRLKEVDRIAVVPFGTFAVLSDIIVAAALVILLKRSQTEFEDTQSLINKLIVYAINRCILTSVVAVIEIALFLAIPHSLYAFAFDFIIGKLYANSLLAHLNSRKSLAKRGTSSGGTFTGTSFEVAAPQVFSLDPISSTTNPTSSTSRGVHSEDEGRSYSTSLSAPDKRRPKVMTYDSETHV
ncbi:hypothetical protein PM082_016097 [Marasmius tenuissimus]|nr:hypothetical protein PM082_016097 [Marasmius tenuissimus]